MALTPDQLRQLSPAQAAALKPLLRALWHDARGDWDAAHGFAQDDPSGDGAWVHALLHRREGDLSNAAYWYRMAGRLAATGTLEDEWEKLASHLLSRLPG